MKNKIFLLHKLFNIISLTNKKYFSISSLSHFIIINKLIAEQQNHCLPLK